MKVCSDTWGMGVGAGRGVGGGRERLLGKVALRGPDNPLYSRPSYSHFSLMGREKTTI